MQAQRGKNRKFSKLVIRTCRSASSAPRSAALTAFALLPTSSARAASPSRSLWTPSSLNLPSAAAPPAARAFSLSRSLSWDSWEASSRSWCTEEGREKGVKRGGFAVRGREGGGGGGGAILQSVWRQRGLLDSEFCIS
jgi:hypothetical protein